MPLVTIAPPKFKTTASAAVEHMSCTFSDISTPTWGDYGVGNEAIYFLDCEI